jgi:hypothetical protein
MFSLERQHQLANVSPIEPALPIVSVSDGVAPVLSMEHQWPMPSWLSRASIAPALNGLLHKQL